MAEDPIRRDVDIVQLQRRTGDRLPVGDVRITRSLDPVFGLDDEAIKAARQWLFEPGTRFGEPVAILVNLALDFNLR